MGDFFYRLLHLGTSPDIPDSINRRIVFSNAVYSAMPVVYVIFMIISLEDFFIPFDQLEFDQFIVPIFILICLACLWANKAGQWEMGRIIFILLWPFALHIIPIVRQSTPSDYYLAYPLGIIFHSILIQVLFSNRKSPIAFWTLLIVNFGTVIFARDFLQFYDTDADRVSETTFDVYFTLDSILYWLLFNLITFYVLQIVENSIIKLEHVRNAIEEQKIELEQTLERLKLTQAKLIQSEKMASIGTLAAGIGHEINNPLNYISGGINQLEKISGETNYTSGFMEGLNLIKEGFERTKIITNTLLTFSRQPTITDEMPTEHQIDDIIAEVMLFMKFKQPDQIDFQINNSVPDSIYIFRSKLNQVLVNLLGNAVDAIAEIQEKGRQIVRIDFDHTNDLLSIVVYNSGTKLTADPISKVFEPFYTTKDPGKGTGLGLWVTYQLIKEMKGEIDINNIDNGVQVKLQIPTTEP